MSNDIQLQPIGASIHIPPPTWYRRLFPWLPACYRIKRIRLFVVQWWDITPISTNLIPWITKKTLY